jgi:hypothetical protein
MKTWCCCAIVVPTPSPCPWAALLGFIAAWNSQRAHPFRWSFTGYPLQAEETLARSA